MGIFKTVKRAFGSKLLHSAVRFGGKVIHTAGKVLDFAKKTALPVAEKIASGVQMATRLATPLVAGVAPELLPVLMGINKISGVAKKGIQSAEKVVDSGQKVVNPLRKLAN